MIPCCWLGLRMMVVGGHRGKEMDKEEMVWNWIGLRR